MLFERDEGRCVGEWGGVARKGCDRYEFDLSCLFLLPELQLSSYPHTHPVFLSCFPLAQLGFRLEARLCIH